MLHRMRHRWIDDIARGVFWAFCAAPWLVALVWWALARGR
jgi:hypothetical protein